jgi:hypothetical protein
MIPRRSPLYSVAVGVVEGRPGSSWPASATPSRRSRSTRLDAELDKERQYREALALGLEPGDPSVRR